MKNFFESEEIFTAHATVGAGYAMMQLAQIEFDKKTAKSPIEKLVDFQTGYGQKLVEEHRKYLCMCLEDIIAAKKVIEADFSKDEDFLNRLKNQINKLPDVYDLQEQDLKNIARHGQSNNQ